MISGISYIILVLLIRNTLSNVDDIKYHKYKLIYNDTEDVNTCSLQ